MGEVSAKVRRHRWRRREPNPLLVKELRGRMRGARAFVVLTIYLLLLSCLTSLIYYAYSANVSTSGSGPDMADLGMIVFFTVVLIELFMVTFITPAFTAGAITGERDRKTYELLRTTLLPTRKLVSGKLTSALIYIGLLILAAVPLEGLAFMLGGVIVEELILALVILLVTVFAIGVLGLFFSSLLRTTLAATVLTYAVVLMTTLVAPVLSMIVLETLPYPYSSWLHDAANLASYATISLSPLGAAIFTRVAMDEGSIWLYDINAPFQVPAAWIIYTIIHLSLGLVLLAVAMWRLRQQEMR